MPRRVPGMAKGVMMRASRRRLPGNFFRTTRTAATIERMPAIGVAMPARRRVCRSASLPRWSASTMFESVKL